jgi:hypothetical protein
MFSGAISSWSLQGKTALTSSVVPGPSRVHVISFSADEAAMDTGLAENEIGLGFGGTIYHEGFFLTVPCWFPVVLSAVLVVVPWIKWRFTVRTLLIATTLVAVVLGLIVYVMRQ